MNKERLTHLSEKLLEIPNMISQHQNQLLDLNERIQNFQNEINQIESTIKGEISSAVDENGKKKWSNDTLRDSAFIEMSSSNPELTSKKDLVKSFQRDLNSQKIRIEALENEQRNIRSILYFFGGAKGEII